MRPEGFKNSQLVDTRIITKYARSYLKSVFGIVHTVNGKITDDFRHYWGLQDDFEKKDRSNHVHHAVDATVVACITRGKYQQLAEAYRQDEEKHTHIHVEKPWSSFVRDVASFQDEIFVSHYAPNNLLKQTKRRLKVKGKTVVQKSKTARGSLHQDTFYGAIKRLEEQRNGEMLEVTKYVSRKPLESLDDKQLENIVDKQVKKIVIAGRLKAKELKKEMETLKKKRPTVDADEESILKQRVEELQNQLDNLYVLPNKNGAPIPIKKVRIYSPLTDPIKLKNQRDVSMKSGREHKQKYYVGNDGVYEVLIIERDGKISSSGIINLEAVSATYTAPERASKYRLQSGQLVFFKDGVNEDLSNLPQELIGNRLYKVNDLGRNEKRVVFRHHAEAREKGVILEENANRRGTKLPSIVNFEDPNPIQRISYSKLDILLEGIDFRLNVLGEVEWLEKEPC